MSDITIERQYGMVLVRDSPFEDFERRWWFQETGDSRLVLREEVSDLTDEYDGRVARDKYEAEVPERIEDALLDDGFESVHGPREV